MTGKLLTLMIVSAIVNMIIVFTGSISEAEMGQEQQLAQGLPPHQH